MKGMLTLLRRLHRDERGAEGLEKLLIVAAVVLPLLGLLIYFRDYITDWVGGEAVRIRGSSDSYDPQAF
ncbi:MAG: hypothetical protein WD294_12930 [Phycisphaeraceae bacterium]